MSIKLCLNVGNDVYIILCHFCVRTISSFEVKDGGLPTPHLDRNKQKKNPGLKIGLDRVCTCLADRAMVSELIITGSTGIARTSRRSGWGPIVETNGKEAKREKREMKTIKINKQTKKFTYSIKELWTCGQNLVVWLFAWNLIDTFTWYYNNNYYYIALVSSDKTTFCKGNEWITYGFF